jgi:hypothetical protein
MLKKFKVEVFCEKPDLSDLIRKAFAGSNYEIHFNSGSLICVQSVTSLDPSCDLIIADKGIEKGLHDVLKKKFPDVPVICLPALEAENEFDSEVKCISEPLKMSELKRVVAETLQK